MHKVAEEFGVGVCCLASFLGPVGQVSAEIVVNGGFETGDLSGWTMDADPWSGVWSGDCAHTGSYYALLNNERFLGRLSQSIPTTAGANYMLTFWLTSEDGCQSSCEFTVSIGEKKVMDLLNPRFSDCGYKPYNVRFTASSAFTALSFGFQTESDLMGSFFLDDVSVVRDDLKP